jgi:hypothetical protein
LVYDGQEKHKTSDGYSEYLDILKKPIFCINGSLIKHIN